MGLCVWEVATDVRKREHGFPDTVIMSQTGPGKCVFVTASQVPVHTWLHF